MAIQTQCFSHDPAVWAVGAMGAGIVGAGLVWWLIPVPSWQAAGAGWLVAVANAGAARIINHMAVGAPRKAFVGWGIGGNAFRILTLAGIFAYIVISCRRISGSFFVSVFASFFILMLVELAGLLRFQDHVRKGV